MCAFFARPFDDDDSAVTPPPPPPPPPRREETPPPPPPPPTPPPPAAVAVAVGAVGAAAVVCIDIVGVLDREGLLLLESSPLPRVGDDPRDDSSPAPLPPVSVCQRQNCFGTYFLFFSHAISEKWLCIGIRCRPALKGLNSLDADCFEAENVHVIPISRLLI